MNSKLFFKLFFVLLLVLLNLISFISSEINYVYYNNSDKIYQFIYNSGEQVLTYDLFGNLILEESSFKDIKNISYFYDDYDRIIFIDNQESSDINYSYFGFTNNISQININNGEQVYTYNEYGSILSEVYANDSSKNIYYTYDEYNNLKTLDSSKGFFIYGYDSRNRLIKDIEIFEGFNKTIEYFYDDNDNLILQKDWEKEIFLEYDLNNNLVYIVEKDLFGDIVQEINYTYDSNFNLVETIDSVNGKEFAIYENLSYIYFNKTYFDLFVIKYIREDLSGVQKVYEFSYDQYGDVSQILLNGEVIESFECKDEFCEYFDGVTTWYQPIVSEEICNGIDDNKNGIIDEGCDEDGDLYVNPDMQCEVEFYSESNSVLLNSSSEDLILNLKENDWNLVSFPINGSVNASYLRDRFTNVSQRCIVTTDFWTWNPEKLRYARVNFTEPGKSYWVYSLNNCSFPLYEDFEATNVEVKLSKGWNLAPFAFDFKNVYPKASSAQVWGENSYTKDLSGDKNSCDAMWVYWDSEKLVNCSRVDLNDLDNLIGGLK